MGNYNEEYLELERQFLSHEISDKEFLERYNRLIEKESDEMIKCEGIGQLHEYI